jgi:hypothetical protein
VSINLGDVTGDNGGYFAERESKLPKFVGTDTSRSCSWAGRRHTLITHVHVDIHVELSVAHYGKNLVDDGLNWPSAQSLPRDDVNAIISGALGVLRRVREVINPNLNNAGSRESCLD